MVFPRSKTVRPGLAGYYHCTSRCVRRAWLCGKDRYTKRSFEHRRAWIQNRLMELCEIFSIDLFAYAVMTNHLHLVVYLDPNAPQAWSDQQVAERWCLLSRELGGPSSRPADVRARQQRVDELAQQPERIAVLRERLGSLSWFMRFLNEPIARAANREDNCRGRFWEGRFHCQFLADDEALLGAMAYVDLNPVRAKRANDLRRADYTSIQRRLNDVRHSPKALGRPLQPIAGPRNAAPMAITLAQYIELVEWSGRRRRRGKRGKLSNHAPSVLDQLKCGTDRWRCMARLLRKTFGAAVGSRENLDRFALETGRKWVKGMAFAW